MNEKILWTIDNGIMNLTLNNSGKLNCIGMETLNQLERHLDEAYVSDKVKLVVISGMGEKAFSSGADLKEFNSLSVKEMDKWIREGNRVFNKLENLPKPTIAYIKGYAIGGGFELALSCDFRVGTQNAVFYCPELKNGWLPGWGGMTRLKHMFGEVIAKEIVLLGKKINAEEALRMRLLNVVFKSNNPDIELNDFLSGFTELKTSIFSLAKQAIMDRSRTTEGVDITFDILALRESLKND